MSIAFKEWAIIVEALGQGKQTLILRKGGIHEGAKGFQPEHDHFGLFPTGFHQHRDKVDAAIGDLDQSLSVDPVEIRYQASVKDVYKIENLEVLRALKSFHHWTEASVEERFEFGKWTGLYCLVLSVQKWATPQFLENKPEYGGCKSWIELPLEWPPDDTLSPVMHAEAVEAVRSAVRDICL